MGRQIHFHMLDADRELFLRHVQQDGTACFLDRYSDSPGVRDIRDQRRIVRDQDLCLWNMTILPDLKRHFVPERRVYALDLLHDPILEFSDSVVTDWQGQPALTQGRLYGIFDDHLEKPRAFEKWFDRLASWVRKNFMKNPFGETGYTAPGACEFFRNGGYLLPFVKPLENSAQIEHIRRQHEKARNRIPSPKVYM